MNNKITINKEDLQNLIGYIHTILNFIDVDDFEDEENVELVTYGYNYFVEPILKVMEENK